MPIPALIAGGLAAGNLIANLYAADQDSKSREKARDYIAGQKQQSDAYYDKMIGEIAQYYKDRGSLGTKQDVADYRAAIQGYDPNDFVYEPDKKFDETYTKTRDDFINPYYEQIIGDTANTVQHTAAGAGLGRGSGAAEAIAKAVAEKNNELYREAQQEYKDDRNFAYNQYNDYIRNMNDILAQKRAATDTKLSMQGNLAQDYYSVMDAAQADRIKAQQDKMSTGSQYATAMMGLY